MVDQKWFILIDSPLHHITLSLALNLVLLESLSVSPFIHDVLFMRIMHCGISSTTEKWVKSQEKCAFNSLGYSVGIDYGFVLFGG